MEKRQALYVGGKDNLGRQVVVFALYKLGEKVDFERLLLYIIKLMDKVLSFSPWRALSSSCTSSTHDGAKLTAGMCVSSWKKGCGRRICPSLLPNIHDRLSPATLRLATPSLQYVPGKKAALPIS